MKVFGRFLIGAFGLGLFAYTCARAFTISITHDEALTFLNYVPKSWLGIALYEPPYIPNSHLLNTLLIKLFTLFIEPTAGTVRLPNLLAHLFYLYFSYRIATKFSSAFIVVTCFVLLNLNVYLLDFFGMARGYGLAMGFTVASIYYLLDYYKNLKNKSIALALILGALAVYSQFTFLNYYASLLALANIIFLIRLSPFKLKQWLVFNIWPLVISVLLALLIIIPLRNVQTELFGGQHGFFWKNTINTLIWAFMYLSNDAWVQPLSYLLAGITLASAALLVFQFSQKKVSPFLLVSLGLAILMSFSTVAQKLLFGIPYLGFRTALLYFIPYLLVIVSFFDALIKTFPRFSPVPYVLSGTFMLGFAANFIAHANFTHTIEWKYDSCSHLIINQLEKLNSSEVKVELAAAWQHQPALKFYKQTQNLNWLEVVDIDKVNEADYWYYLPDARVDPLGKELIFRCDNHSSVYREL